MDGFNVGLELRSGLLPTVWDSPLRMIQRHAITILILQGGNDFPALVPQRYNLDENLEGIALMIVWRALHSFSEKHYLSMAISR